MVTKKKKGSRTAHFLIGSFLLLLVISIAAFVGLGHFMSQMSAQSIEKVGNLYMAGINEHISAHFRMLIDLKLEQVEAVLEVVPTDPEAFDDADEIDAFYQELVYQAGVRNFNYLALCAENGRIQMLDGKQLRLADPEPFFESLRNREKKVAVGSDTTGNKVVIFGIGTDYPMANGEKSMALLAAVPIDYFSTMLSTNTEDALISSYIIRTDGSFIVTDVDTEYTNYFSSLYGRYRDADREKIDTYIERRTTTMAQGKDYSGILSLGGSSQQVYCMSLPYSEWHLVTVLPLDALSEVIETLDWSQTSATLFVSVVVPVVLLIIFCVYFRMTRQQLKELEAARQEALQATQAKSEFLSNMSHDIRTPMNAIVGMTAIATAHIDDKEQVRTCLKKITLSGKHLLGLINDVLDMSKIESGKMTLTAEQISLREVVEGIVGIVQTQVKAKSQSFHVHIDNIETENVYCDSVRLNQIMLNLLSNAVKYTQAGGVIQLSLFQEDAPPEKGERYVRTHITVKDNGMGMTPAFLEHIFDSYSRADSKRVSKTEGTGLGMAITKYIVDAMGGTISVKSEVNRGTEFQVILDLEKAETREINMVLPPWRMLVVDDDETLCQTAVEALESIGIQADWTQSGSKAVEMIAKHHQAREDYEIILLDWKLPDTDGILVAKQIRKIVDVEMPIILISAYDWSDFEKEAREAGINGFISKPLFKSTLFYGLKKYMETEQKEEAPEADLDLSGLRLLVAEDNELNWEILQELLSDVGIELDWAEDGKICLEKFQQSPQGYYAAILMDVRMPVMDGYESTRAIRGLQRPDAQTIPIIAMTADAFAEDIKRCLDSGMDAHTAKPINLDETISLLKKYLL